MPLRNEIVVQRDEGVAQRDDPHPRRADEGKNRDASDAGETSEAFNFC